MSFFLSLKRPWAQLFYFVSDALSCAGNKVLEAFCHLPVSSPCRRHQLRGRDEQALTSLHGVACQLCRLFVGQKPRRIQVAVLRYAHMAQQLATAAVFKNVSFCVWAAIVQWIK